MRHLTMSACCCAGAPPSEHVLRPPRQTAYGRPACECCGERLGTKPTRPDPTGSDGGKILAAHRYRLAAGAAAPQDKAPLTPSRCHKRKAASWSGEDLAAAPAAAAA